MQWLQDEHGVPVPVWYGDYVVALLWAPLFTVFVFYVQHRAFEALAEEFEAEADDKKTGTPGDRAAKTKASEMRALV